MTRSARDAGQAAPIYITMVAGLLFLALAFFAVGQAGATRNGAQSAADAAALAAAQESRDSFREGLLASLLNPEYLDDIFNGNVVGTPADGCAAASSFALQNKADVDGCDWLGGSRWGYTVHVVTRNSMGDSILPGTEHMSAKAQATAIVESRCSFRPAGGGGTRQEGEADPADTKPVSPGTLVCRGVDWSIDPEHLDLLPDMADLFSVRLAQD
ncbi:pilus assembly protein TadG-related protein [Streptomyces sp. NPDC087850]|uniref:pilus assembly protein TadG-related protein n=1 Tax=unclassified Streptomyces TaxID=2593676 RepID=UPI003810D4DE